MLSLTEHVQLVCKAGPLIMALINNVFPPQPLRSVLDLLLTVGARTCQHGSIYYLYYRCKLAAGSPDAKTETWVTLKLGAPDG